MKTMGKALQSGLVNLIRIEGLNKDYKINTSNLPLDLQ